MQGTRVIHHITLALLLAASLRAQNGPAPVSIANKLDTPQACVYVATLLPHMPSRSPNGHATNRVLVYLDDGVMTRGNWSRRSDVIRWLPASRVDPRRA